MKENEGTSVFKCIKVIFSYYKEVTNFVFSKEENKINCKIYSVHKRKEKSLLNKNQLFLSALKTNANFSLESNILRYLFTPSVKCVLILITL